MPSLAPGHLYLFHLKNWTNESNAVATPDAARPSSEVYSDIDAIMAYYEQVAATELANEFYAELRHFMVEAAKRPKSFAIRERDIRRVNLRRFPYHSLFRLMDDTVRVLVVRHHSRHPSLGTRRR